MTRTPAPGRAAASSPAHYPIRVALALAGATALLGPTACTGAEGVPPVRRDRPAVAPVGAPSPSVRPLKTSATSATLAVTEGLKIELANAYFKSRRHSFPGEKRGNVIEPTDVSFGVVWGVDSQPSIYYAVGMTGFTDKPVSRQGGPQVWRKEGDAAWTYVGDTAGVVCAKVPRDLYVLWGFEAKHGRYEQCRR